MGFSARELQQRLDLVRALGQFPVVDPGWWKLSKYKELAPIILAAFRDPSPEVRVAALHEILSLEPLAEIPAVAQGIQHALKDMNEEVVQAAVEAIGQFRMSSVMPRLAKLLRHKQLSVRRAACDAIGCMGDSATGALPELTKALINDQDMRQSAARSIAAIPESEEYLVHAVRTGQDQVLDSLNSAGENAQRLAEALQSRWNAVVPPAGYERREFKEIVDCIFGPAIEARGGRQNQERNAHNWMANLKLRAIAISRGTYHVHTDDLNRLRQLHSSGGGSSGQSVDD